MAHSLVVVVLQEHQVELVQLDKPVHRELLEQLLQTLLLEHLEVVVHLV
jgi:hypothetical protein